MGKKRDDLVDGMIADDSGGWLANLLADEEPYDRRMLWQLGSWAAAALGSLAVAFLVAQTSNTMRQDVAAANDLVRQTQQIATIATERETDARRLASAIETLNTDRDRLYARVTGIEQNLDTVTSAIKSRAVLTPFPLPTPPQLSTPPDTVAPPAPLAKDERLSPSKDEKIAALPKADPNPRSDVNAALPRIPLTSPAPPADADASKSAVAARTPPKAENGKSDLGKPDSKAEVKPAPANEPAPKAPVAAVPSDAKPEPAEKKAEPTDTKAPEVAASPPELIGPPAPPASAPIVTSALPPPPADAAEAEAQAEVPVTKTEFGVDLGTASSIEGLRALWRGVQTSNKTVFGSLRPIVTFKERSGLGMQLRLVAGPVSDAATAARICAVLTENGRSCETAFFDGQRLTPGSEYPPAQAAAPAPPRKRSSVRTPRRTIATPPRVQRSSFSSFLGGN